MNIQRPTSLNLARTAAIAVFAALVGLSLFQLQASATFVPAGASCGGTCSVTVECQGECACYFYPNGTAKCIDALKR